MAETPPIFRANELNKLRKKDLPFHVAIAMDGNRRWAKKNLMASAMNIIEGHNAGAQIIHDIVKAAQEIGIKVLTLWAFSTENWKRTKFEVDGLIDLLTRYLQENQMSMVENGVRFSTIGNLNPFPLSLKNEIIKTEELTKNCKKIDLVIALNYGGRDDITRAIKKIITSFSEKQLDLENINEELVGQYLDGAKWKDPDLLIRTSHEMRISNFILWQLAYTELFFSEKLWPDFTPKDLLDAVIHFQCRERREGK